MLNQYSKEQEIAFQKYKEGKNIFITGPGGTGKSKLIKDIKIDAIKELKDVQVCALTGCAAVLLECKAKTLHSWAGIGLATGSKESILRRILNNSFRATRILNADFINPYKPLMFFFLYISYYSVYFYSNLYYKHK